MKAQDLLLDDDFDLAFTAQGDLAVGESDPQHIELLLRTAQGDWRQDPLVGVGIFRYLKSAYGPAQAATLARDITIQLGRDGFRVLQVDTTTLADTLINAERP